MSHTITQPRGLAAPAAVRETAPAPAPAAPVPARRKPGLGALVAILTAVVALMLLAFVVPAVHSGAEDLPLAVSGPEAAVGQVVTGLDARQPGAFDVAIEDSADAVVEAVQHREAVGGIALAADGVTVYTASGAGTPYVNGMRRAAWSGNRVAVGGAAAIVDPVLGTALLLAHDDIARLIALLPHDPADTRVEAAEFNRRTRTRAEAARDAAVALWATNARTGQPLWDRAREHAPPALAHRIALYRSHGHVPVVEHDPLSRADWATLFDGQGLRQRRLDPQAAAIPQAEAEAHLARIHARLTAAARTMPPHAHALAQLRPTR